MATPTVEDYLKNILLAQHRQPGAPVGMGEIAALLGVTPGTVTPMVKGMAGRGLLHYQPYTGAQLTDEGRALATRVLRRHRILELVLVRELGLDWSEVHDDAERLEHAASDRVVERMAERMGHPRRDPHGDPIPAVGEELPPPLATTLANCDLTREYEVVRVMDQSAGFLRRIREMGLAPGARVTAVERDPTADCTRVEMSGSDPVVLVTRDAAQLLVRAR